MLTEKVCMCGHPAVKAKERQIRYILTYISWVALILETRRHPVF